MALLIFNLATMSTCRDIAMLGMIHRAALGKGPSQLQQLFAKAEVVRRRPTRAGACVHDRQLREYRTGYFSELLSRSALGLVSVYNLFYHTLSNESKTVQASNHCALTCKGRPRLKRRGPCRR